MTLRTPNTRYTWLVLLVLSLMWGYPSARAAESPRPVAVLSVASANRLLNDMSYLTRVFGRAELGGMVHLMTADLLQNIDPSKPSGVYVTLGSDQQPRGIGFIPVKDLEKVLAKVNKQFSVEAEQLDNGIRRLGTDKGVYLKQVGPWLFFSDHARYLVDLPADPSELLQDLDQTYDMALRVHTQDIPKSLRDAAVKQLTTGVRMGLDPTMADTADANKQLAAKIESTLGQTIDQLINQTDELTVGWTVQPRQRRMRFDFTMTALQGSELATQLASLSKPKTTFPGILMSDAAILAHGAFQLSPQDIEQASALVRLIKMEVLKAIERDPHSPPQLKQIFGRFADIIAKTIAEGFVDAAGALQVAPRSLRFVGAARAADGIALGKAFREIYELAKSEPDVPNVQFNVETFQGVHFHSLSVPIPESEKETRQALGDQLDVVIGTSAKAVYLAFGTDCVKLLKEAISKSSQAGAQSVAAARIRVSVKPLIRFLASVNHQDKHLAALAELAKQVQEGDQVSLVIDSIDRGARCQLEIQEGVMVILGRAAQLEKDSP